MEKKLPGKQWEFIVYDKLDRPVATGPAYSLAAARLHRVCHLVVSRPSPMLNLPTKVTFEGTNKFISYLYTATGQKVQKLVRHQDSSSITKYLHGFQYYDNVLQFWHHPEGYVKNTPDINGNPSFDYVYQYRDHLGNVRVNYAQDPQTGLLEILEENHYYPFGLQHANYNTDWKEIKREEENNEKSLLEEVRPHTPVANRGYQYMFNGQEYNQDFGLNVTEMTFRQYDPAIGRFNGVDRFAALMPSITPYRFGFNNPILWADPTGLIEESVLMDMFNRSGSGSTTWQNDGHSGFYTDDGGYVGYTSDDTAFNTSPGDLTMLPEVTVTLGNQESYQNAANQIAQNIYKTKWYNEGADLLGLGISATGNVASGFHAFGNYTVASQFKSNSSLWEFQKLTAKQKAWRTNAVLVSDAKLGKYGSKLLKGAKVLGPVATVAGTAYSGHKIYNGTATTIDYVDAGVGVASLGAAVFLASNPVGWAISAGAGIYFAGRFIYDLIDEAND